MKKTQIYKTVESLIGNTPVLELGKYTSAHTLHAKIYAKLEFFNPGGSVKDRIANAMLSAALRAGEIDDETIIVEPTSGNTGIGLAMLCAELGLHLILTMSESMSAERRDLMTAYGAEIRLTPATAGMVGSIEEAHAIMREYAEQNIKTFMPSQFSNPANPAIHYTTTGPEIWQVFENNLDFFVAGIGTGGTISGTARFLKEKNPAIKIIGFEPSSSPFLTQRKKGTHKIQGIGAGFKPDNLDLTLIDEILTITDEEAIEASRYFAHNYGLLIGISSGAAIVCAKKIAERTENNAKTILALFPDSGSKYISTGIYNK